MKFLLITTVLMPLLAIIMFLLYYGLPVHKEQVANVCFYIAIGALVLTAILGVAIAIVAIITMA